MYFYFDHEHLHLDTFQYVIHLSANHSTLCSLRYRRHELRHTMQNRMICKLNCIMGENVLLGLIFSVRNTYYT